MIISVYNTDAERQITQLSDIIDSDAALGIWRVACATKWQRPPVWIHGDFASGNILIRDNKLAAIIDFGCMGLGDPACDLVIAWTYLTGDARNLFIDAVDMDADTWLRAKAWALWKATFELCQISDRCSAEGVFQNDIINRILS